MSVLPLPRRAGGHPPSLVAVTHTPALAPRRSASRAHAVAGAALGAATLYATVRYNAFKGVPWADWPSYTVNKSLAVASLLLIAIAAVRLARRRGATGTLLAWSGALALAHTLLSFALFTPGYFPRLFDGARLSAAGGVSVLLGAAAMAAMELGARRAGGWSPGWRGAALALTALASGVHAAVPGLASWFDPQGWPGFLPPLTLISFVAGLVALAAWARSLRTA